MRTRSSSSQLVYPTAVFTRCVGGTCSHPSSSSFTDQSKVFRDDVRPGYFVAKRTGGILPVGPMESEQWERELFAASAQVTADLWTGTDWLLGYYDMRVTDGLFYAADLPVTAAPPMPTLNQDALVQKALANAQTDAWDVLTFAAEFHKTVALLSTARRRWWEHFQRVYKTTKSRLRDAQKVGDTFASVWLEYRFGLRPLLYDIQSINETLRRLQEGIPTLARGYASDITETVSHGSTVIGNLSCYTIQGSTPVGVSAFSTAGTSTEHSWVWTRTLSGRASVGVEVTTRGLTSVDLPVTLWELAPWSVFVDYFLNVGDILRAFSPMATGDLAYATYSTELVEVVTQTSQWKVTDSGNLRWNGSGASTGAYITRHTVRNRKVVFPTPTLQLSFDLDLSQLIDLIAVIWGCKRRAHSLLKLLASRR